TGVQRVLFRSDRDLAHARVALRVRRDGEQYIQTLKSRGQSLAGLSERNEWDWYLQAPELDPSLLSDDCWPASLAALDKATLQPLFTTDFVREKADLGWGEGEEEVDRKSTRLNSSHVKISY